MSEISKQSPMYNGDHEGSLKELGPQQRQILELQLADLDRLNQSEMYSDLRGQLLAGEPLLPAGTLLHGTRYSPQVVASIAEHGVMSGELFGIPEDAETHYCADFFRLPEETTIGDYTQWVSENEPNPSGLRARRMEGNYLPNPKTRGRLGFVVDAGMTEVQTLLEADAYRPGTDELFDGIINRLPIDKNSPKAERVAAILGGVPRGAIAGIIVSPDLAENAERIAEIAGAFDGRVPVLSISGQVIA